MMAKTVDARGLSCPQPVLLALDAIKSGSDDEIIVLVDSEASKENVGRAAAKRGWATTDISEEAGEFTLTLKKG
jgi:TusA-related sulfurtransferase